MTLARGRRDHQSGFAGAESARHHGAGLPTHRLHAVDHHRYLGGQAFRNHRSSGTVRDAARFVSTGDVRCFVPPVLTKSETSPIPRSTADACGLNRDAAVDTSVTLVSEGGLPTNPTHRFELPAGTLRSQPTIRRCECIAGRPPALRGGHQRLDQLPLGVGQVGRIAPCSWPQVHRAQNVLACLNVCSA
jgi:hypothetical protein